jgi:nucleoid-associated protein YgaU
MGNLEKAGIGVVVVLLLVIMVVAFVGDGQGKAPPSDDKGDGASLVLNRNQSAPINPENQPSTPPNTSKEKTPREIPVAEVVSGGDPIDNPGPLVVPTPTPATPPPVKEVVVKDGDKLWKILADYYGPNHADAMVKVVAEASGLPDPSQLTKGQILRLPPLPDRDKAEKPAVVKDNGPVPENQPKAEPKPKKRTVHVVRLPLVPGPQNYVKIEVEESDTYTIANGDTLGTIAQRLLGSASRAQEIADLNGITNLDSIQKGEVLRMPKK